MRKILTLVCLCSVLMSWGWGQKGHDVTAYIAEQHLAPAAKEAVNDLLDGKSMVYWACWLDNASNTPEYAYTKTWHYKNVDEGVKYEDMTPNPKGDAVTAVKSSIETLKSTTASRDEKVLALKILIHVVGDMHQPMHMGHATDLGGNQVKIKFFNRDRNLHGVWDSDLIDGAHKWSFTEWQVQLDRLSEAQEEALTKGSIDDWAKETMAITTQVYKATPAGTDLRYNDIARWTPIIEQQVLTGGIRLAYLLNTIFK